jgi:hypothetical protein
MSSATQPMDCDTTTTKTGPSGSVNYKTGEVKAASGTTTTTTKDCGSKDCKNSGSYQPPNDNNGGKDAKLGGCKSEI